MSLIEVDAEVTPVVVEVEAQVTFGTRGVRSWTAVFTSAGPLEVFVGDGGFPVPYDSTLDVVLGTLASPPVGAAAIADVNVNGTTIWPTQALRLTFAPGETYTTATPEDALVAQGDRLTVDVDQIGSTSPGVTLVVVIVGTEV